MSNAVEHYTPDEDAPATIVSQSDAMLTMIERVAMNPAADLDKMQRLLDMKRDIMAQEAKIAFTRSMKAAQSEMPQVTRDSENSHTKSRYAKLETISAAMNPIITKHGFSISFGTDKSDLANHYGVTCEVEHEGGHSKQYRADIPSDAAGSQGKANKNATQAFGSTMTYGRRYLKCLIFDVQVTDDDDGNSAEVTETITDAQRKRVLSLIEETSTDIARFCGWLNIEAIPDIPANRFDEVIDRLLQKKGKTDGR